MNTPSDDDINEMTEEEYQDFLEMIIQLWEAEHNHSLYTETADNRTPPPFIPKGKRFPRIRQRRNRKPL